MIGACSRYDGPDPRVVADRVAATLGLDAGEVADRLTSGAGAVLGPQNLLWPWRAGVQWNPADDRCVAATLRVRRGTDAARPAVGAEVFIAAPTAAPTAPSHDLG